MKHPNKSLSRKFSQAEAAAKAGEEPSKASRASEGRKPETPKGCVVRTGHRLTLRPIRNAGPRDATTLEQAVRDFGYLIPMGALVVETLAGFATLIELNCSNKRARALADALHRFSA